MLEVRSFDGTAEELSDFVFQQWCATYEGRMLVPHWGADYFRWQLQMDDPQRRCHLIAAYRGAKLAGVVLHFPMQFAIGKDVFTASQASWLSVSPEFRGQGVGSALNRGSRAFHRDRKLRFQLGFAYFGHRASLASRFWLKSQTDNTTPIRSAGFWIRILDSKATAEWNLNRWESGLTTIVSPLIPPPKVDSRPSLTIRPARTDDVTTCLALVNRATSHCDLRIVWNEETLSRQLGLHGFSKSLVAQVDGEVKGFVTFHILPIVGRNKVPVGILDLVVVSDLASSDRNSLVDAALLALQQEGAAFVLKLRVGDHPAGLFLRRGWYYQLPQSHVLVTWAEDAQKLPPLKRLHVLWR
ncbi:hypothetical protein [Schlesneria sp. T3-172]|uniref:hypothetical protein n=1 Tax=Schlesneria sphaerica TaxID=3373610 RepID=UPI0037C8ABDF